MAQLNKSMVYIIEVSSSSLTSLLIATTPNTVRHLA